MQTIIKVEKIPEIVELRYNIYLNNTFYTGNITKELKDKYLIKLLNK